MLHSRRLIQIGLGTVALTCIAIAVSRGVASSESRYSYETDIEPVLAQYCYDCHGEGMDKGGIVLDEHFSSAELIADRRLWENVYHNMEGHLMPPGDKAQPSDEERAKMVAWIERDVFELDAENPDPGRVTLRRLNREEYNNTVSDLFATQLTPAEGFAEDDSGYGFDNIGDVLSLSPDLFERYLKVSGELLDTIIVTKAPLPQVMDFTEDDFRGVGGFGDRTGGMSSTAATQVKVTPPADGEYEITIVAGGDQGGEFWPNMRVEVEQGATKEFTVDAPRASAGEYLFKTSLKKGQSRKVQMSFTNDFYDPKNKDPEKRDRNLWVYNVRVRGPLDQPVPPPTRAHQRILSLAPKGLPEEERSTTIIKQFAGEAWRRPVSEEELKRVLSFYQQARDAGGSFDLGIKRALQAVLVSPKFLFRGEMQPSPDNPEAVHEIDEFSLATRLSYFLWSTTPDEELLAEANAGTLRKNLDEQINRLLTHPRAADALTKNFAGQWLQLRNLRLAAPDKKTFPQWSGELRNDMLEETETFFATMVQENRPVLELLDADYTWLNERLATFYGVPNVKGDQFQRVSLNGKVKEQRGGLITHASILTITSNPTRTSAVNRGNFVLENFLGTPPPPPPEGVDIPPLEASAKKDGKTLTLRQQLEAHREKKICASCHARMDPIGFGLENFDGIGAWRDEENGLQLDTSGSLYTGESFNGPAELREVFVEAKTGAFVRNMADKLLTYSLGRGTEYYDKPAVREIAKKTAEGDFRFHAMVKAVVNSAPFQLRRGDSAVAE